MLGKFVSACAAALCGFGVFGAICTYEGEWDAVPTDEADAIVVKSGALSWTMDLPHKVASWTQSGGMVTFETTFDDTFPKLEVTGDVVLSGGTWTHKGNAGSATKKNRLYVSCGGDFTLGADATVSGFGLGYGTQLASIYGLAWQGSTQGGSHGGHGGLAVATKNFTYGCYYAPEDLGNAGKWMNTLTGGGAVRLDVGGTFTQNGTITVNSDGANCGGNYSGAGGSIFINAAAIKGAGKMTANAADTYCPGAGGRIAIILNGRDGDGKANGFENYDVLNLVEAVPLRKAAKQGGPGTIYCETADDTPHEGWMILKGNGTEPTDNKLFYADPFTYEYTTLHFNRLTVTGSTLLRIGEGCTLDLKGTTLELGDKTKDGLAIDGGTLVLDEGADWDIDYKVRYWDSGTTPPINVLSGGILIGGSPAKTFAEDVTVAGVLESDYKLTFKRDLTILSGGVVRQSAGGTASPTVKLQLAVGRNLTIEEGGKIDSDGRGYSYNSCPQGSMENGWGGSHGGAGLNLNTRGLESPKYLPYGSIRNPQTHGSGGSNNASGTFGGGVVMLEVGGTLKVDGAITSCSAASQHYPGAGGSINITAGALTGAATGAIRANAGNSNQANSVGAGGRIAVRLTGSGSGFSSFAGAITAYGSVNNVANGLCGGAGTVWLKTAAQDESEGTLIVANSPTTTRATGGSTPLLADDDNSDLVFGDVIIGAKAKVTLASGTTLSVGGSFSNGCQFVAGEGSTVKFVGDRPASVYGTTTFDSVECAVPGKVITVGDGASIVVGKVATFSGSPSARLVMKPAVTGGTWTFDGTSASTGFSDVDLGGCQSVGDLTVNGGTDLGGNSPNVQVKNVEPVTLTWTGVASDSWSADANWSSSDGDPRAPLAIDTVVVPATARQPRLVAAASCAVLTVAEGAVLNLGDKNLTVSGTLTVGGSLAASGAQTISVGGDCVLTGSFVRGNSTVVLNGAAVQTVMAASPFHGLAVAGPGATFVGDIEVLKFTAGGAAPQTLGFEPGKVFKASVFKVLGDLVSAPVTLGASGDGSWRLLVYASDVKGVKVMDCDASAGLPVVPSSSQDAGNNANWIFNDTRVIWDGTTELVAGMDVVLETGKVATVLTDIDLGSLELREGAKLTVSASVNVERNVLVGTGATLVWDRPATIGGQLVILDDANLTHSGNSNKEVNKLDLTVGGGGYLAANGRIDVSEKGYASGWGPGSGNGGIGYNSGATYGGCGYCGNMKERDCYGSFSCPTNCGSGGRFDGTPPTYSAGGGAVRLAFGGAFTLDGKILSTGAPGYYYTGSGGSIWITASSLNGTGTVQARGGTGTQALNGGGGRISFVLTGEGADFSEFTGSVDAWGGFTGNISYGSAGTVYYKTPADGGVLVIKNNPNGTNNDYYNDLRVYGHRMNKTDLVSADFCGEENLRDLTVRISDYATLNLRADAEIADLYIEGESPRILLNGHTLRVHAYNHYGRNGKEKYPGTVVKRSDDGAVDGEIVWDKPGLTVIVR